MIKDYFLNEIETAIKKAIKDNKLGEMKEYTRGSLSLQNVQKTQISAILQLTFPHLQDMRESHLLLLQKTFLNMLKKITTNILLLQGLLISKLAKHS